MTLKELVPILQMSIGPVILISGIGLLLLSMTNRIGRVIDRARVIVDLQRRSAEPIYRLHEQLRILQLRARLIRLAIAYATLSCLLAAMLIITLFVCVLLHLEAAVVVILLFVSCLACLIVSLVLFLRDVNVALKALMVEMDLPLNA